METICFSRHFDYNVFLVAGVCARCYQRQRDVKIVGVNRKFLQKKNAPPRSPHNLIEESFSHDPWSLLVATIFLNKTSCMMARPYVEKFLEDHPTPEAVLMRKPEELEGYFAAIGLKKRARQLWRMSYDYVHKKWRDAGELHGIGKYGRDAFRLFCMGDLGVEPADRFLRIYKAWWLLERKTSCSNGDGLGLPS